MQVAILDILSGRAIRQCYTGGPLTTGELVEELQEIGFTVAAPRHQALATVRRACDSLVRRGKLRGTYSKLCDPPFSETIEWEAQTADSK
jgi:hypothetical protein